MKEFEYRVENLIAESNQEIQEYLNDMGDGGWELINTHMIREERTGKQGGTIETYIRYFFKRVKGK